MKLPIAYILFLLVAVGHTTEGPTANIYNGTLGFSRIFFMIFENEGFNDAYSDPNFKQFALDGMLLTNYYTTYHPSQPNYIVTICASTMGCVDDTDVNIEGVSIVDLLEDFSMTWKSYDEAYPGNCYAGHKYGTYYRKHNPFISMVNIQSNPKRCSLIVNAQDPLVGLDADLAKNALPQYSYYTPDINDDDHDTNITYAGQYLVKFFSERKFPAGTLIFVTFDEDAYDENNHLYAVLQGSMVAKGTTDDTAYSHNSYTKTVEKNWKLGTLNKDDLTANYFTMRPTGTQTAGAISVSG